METYDRETKVHEEDTLVLSLSTTEEKYQINDDDDAEDDLVLRQIVADQTNSSFLNFEGCKQMETDFHKETGDSEKDVLKDAIKDNDTIFRELCEKYLNKVNNTSMVTKHKTDFEKSFSQPQRDCDFDTTRAKQRESFTQFSFSLPKIQPLQPNISQNNFKIDIDMSAENNLYSRRKSTSFTNCKTSTETALDSNTILQKSHSFNQDNQTSNTASTQQLEEDVAEDDDDGFLLSDDEVNYSIWQANKTGNFQISEQSDMENEIISISDADSSDEENKELLADLSHKDLLITPEVQKELLKELSFTDFDNQSIATEKSSNLEIESHSDFEILTSKYNESRTPIQEDVNFDRSEFGILEEYSQPIDLTPNLPTPTKLLMEASFLNSPTEKSLSMKQSSHKFKELLNSLDTKPPPSPSSNTVNDFDEFDNLVYTSSLKTKENSIKQSQGIEKLLTAEISFSEEVPALQTPFMSTKYSSEVQEIKCNNKTYTLRYDYSHKPNYTQLSESELLKQLYNYGIKPLKRKQAIKMLEYIYNQTHPILIEETENKQNTAEKYDKEFDQPCTSKSALETENCSFKHSINVEDSAKEATSLTQAMTTKFKLNLQDSCGQDMLLYSNVLKAELIDESYILQTNVTKKTPRPLLPFHIAWYNLVCSNRQLHETILMYEPIDLQEVYLFLKGLGYRYEPKDMKTFFDRRCIIFRYDLTPPTKAVNRHVRKSKNKKVK
ncbi:hypothetical protein DOY81_002881 [Sarcophaga bullata]|nr:hypothetical protein DOY81_002881 [Sarcophaga bullata]